VGLDITAYETVERIGDEFDPEKEDEYYDAGKEYFSLYLAHESFADHADDITPGAFTSNDEAMGFRAGSYGGYNHWREWLSERALGVSPEQVWHNLDKYRDKPFFELIHFSDCEGFIGPKTSAKLAKDFAEHAEQIKEEQDEYNCAKYDLWQSAFELAADTGVVKFH
jgi:hypothetical protein